MKRSIRDDTHAAGLPKESATQPPFDVAIVGGGPAGSAAALVLGRMRRRVLLLDADDPAHGVSDAVHGLFGHDGTPPLELRRMAREQLRPYESVTVEMTMVEEARPTPSGFSIASSGMTSEAGVLLLATGMRYELPPIEGVAEIWARGVSTARTVTAGRCAIDRSLPTEQARRTSRLYSPRSATTSCCSPTGTPTSTPTRPSS